MFRERNPMTIISPREAFLEREYIRLKAENEYLRQRGVPRYSALAEPEVIALSHTSHTLTIAATAEIAKDPYGFHVYVRENYTKGQNLCLKYFVSDLDLYTARDRAAVMGEMHERLVLNIGRELWGKA